MRRVIGLFVENHAGRNIVNAEQQDHEDRRDQDKFEGRDGPAVGREKPFMTAPVQHVGVNAVAVNGSVMNAAVENCVRTRWPLYVIRLSTRPFRKLGAT